MTSTTNSALPSSDTPLHTLSSPLVWMMLKVLLALICFALVAGLLVGLFTYGRPQRRKTESDGFIEGVMDLGIMLTHSLIDWLRGRGGSKNGATWLDDRQILALMRGMTPTEFEEFVAKMFTAFGYKTELNGGAGDGGVDINMTKDGRAYVVQCKKFMTQKVNPHDVRDFYGAMGDRHIDGKGFFVTTNIFTLEAERFADGKPIDMIDHERLVALVRESGILAGGGTQKSEIESKGDKCPKCGADLVERTNRIKGNRFYGCSRFPKCRYTRPLN